MSQNNEELKHYGVLGMKWGKRKSSYHNMVYNYHTKKAKKLEERAKEKQNSFMNNPNRKLRYAQKEQRHANAENFYNKKALGLSYISKLTGSTLDYSTNKIIAGKHAIRKEKYSLAKAGYTNKVNRLKYRAEKQKIKANKALMKQKITDLKVDGATKDKINEFINSNIGDVRISNTWQTKSSFKDKKSKLPGYASNYQSSI